jgi:predicted Rossmann-fold nucleotide-binding protein
MDANTASQKGGFMKVSDEIHGPVSSDNPPSTERSVRLDQELRSRQLPMKKFMIERIASIVTEAQYTQSVLEKIQALGAQITWLGSRTLAGTTQEYKWFYESARLLALVGFHHKTGKGGGLMMAPHHACHAVNRPDLVIGAAAGWLHDKEADHKYLEGGHIFQMPNFNYRHDVLFHGSVAMVIGAGRLGTWHELYDLLNRLKHSLLADVPVYLVERDGYFSHKFLFSTNEINKVLGPRVTKDDFAKAKIIDIRSTTPVQFAAMVLKDLNCEAFANDVPGLEEVVAALRTAKKRSRNRTRKSERSA